MVANTPAHRRARPSPLCDLQPFQKPRDSIVVHLWKELAPTSRRHVERAPERIDKIAGAMVLFRSGRGKAHLRAPEVPDRTVLLLEHVEDCFVPILSVRDSMLCAHSLGEF